MKKLYLPNLKFLSLAALSIAFLFLTLPNSSLAISSSEWRAGHIIDDSIFYNPHSMGTTEIQNFLSAKVSNCDTNGDKPHSSCMIRRDYAATKGYYPPFTCLKDYMMDVSSKPADSYCSGSVSAGNKSAAEIINEVSKACGINPMVLIVTLQKEQSLVTDDWPWSIQYRSAMGYGCPDSAACNSTYYGFFNQVYAAARQFQRYKNQANLFNYQRGRSSYVQYNPNGGCGGSNIYMQTHATAGLYNYTPYQPNSAALNNLYGTGDSCSAYGNRNFWRLFNDWFGSPWADRFIFSDMAHPDGTLLRPAAGPNANNVYLLKDGGAAFATSQGGFQSWGFDFAKVKIATQGDLNLMAAHDADTNHSSTPKPLQFREGTLVKGSGPTVYVIQNVNSVNRKRSLENLDNFTRLGYTFSDVMTIPDSELDAITTDAVYGSSQAAHPNGTLIGNSGSPDVYYIINGERHSMTSANIFSSHGFKWSQVKTVVPGDLQLPTTWPVTWFGEGTLIKGSSSTVYIVDLDVSGVNQSKRNFVTYYNFVGLDYKFPHVVLVGDNELPSQNGTNIGE